MSWLAKLNDLFFEKEEKSAEGSFEAKPEISIDIKALAKKASDFFKQDYPYCLALVPLLIFALWIRLQNFGILAGKYLLELDSYSYYRYAAQILANGSYAAFDAMRRAPIGTSHGLDFFPYLLAGWDKIVMALSGQPQLFAHVLYPAVFGVIGFVFFFLLVKELFNAKVALAATAFLAVVPTYLYRTVAGFADHEAMAMVWMYAALWTFLLAFKESRPKKKYAFAAISGLLTFAAASTWVGFMFMIFPVVGFVIVAALFSQLDRRFAFAYTLWAALFIVPYGLLHGKAVLYSVGVYAPLFSVVLLWACIIYPKLKLANYAKKYISPPLQSVIATVLLLFVLNLFLKIVDVRGLLALVLHPAESSGRVAHTISEIIGGTDLYGPFGALVIFGAIAIVWLVYRIFGDWKRTLAFASPLLVFILPAFFKGYSIHAYLSLLILAVALVSAAYIFYYWKQGDKLFENLRAVHFFPLVFIMFSAYIVKSAARFLFLFSPVIALLAAFSAVSLVELALQRREQVSKLAGVILLAGVCYLFASTAGVTIQNARSSGSNLPGAWEQVFDWIRDSTPQESIITHWWDYGYWTQTVGERASTHDGGTHNEYDLYLLGRYGMTAPNPADALAYFKTYGVDYLLFSEEEIGKYHAFSYIGSDASFDRRSTIGVFALQQEKEVRDGTRRIYAGQWGLDKDIILNNKVYAEGRSAIVGFTLDKTEGGVSNPVAYISDGSPPVAVPVPCVCVNGRCAVANASSELGGCFVLIPYFNSPTDMVEAGGALYLSSKVSDGLFARLYLKGEKLDGFEEAYTDNIPLAIYSGRIIGPKRVWKISPPSEIRENPAWLWNNTVIYGYEKDFHRDFE